MNCTFEADTTSVQTGVKNTHKTTNKEQSIHFGVFFQHYPFKWEESNKVEYLHCWLSTDPNKSTYKIIHKTQQTEISQVTGINDDGTGCGTRCTDRDELFKVQIT